jgi:hypothetical protein
MQKWEYKVVKKLGEAVSIGQGPGGAPRIMPVEEFVNLRGDEGWELFFVEPLPATPQNQFLYFKRPKA